MGIQTGIAVDWWRKWFSRGKEPEGLVGILPPLRFGGDRGVVVPGNYESYIRANKGHVANCTRIRGEGVAAVDRKLYITKKSKSTTFPFTRTKALTAKQRNYVWATSEKFIQDAAEVVEVLDHPVLDLLRTVRVGMNGAGLNHLTSGWMDITGNAYWYTPLNATGVPAEIWIIFSQHIRPHAGADRRVDSYIYKQGGDKEITYDIDEIVHFRLPSYRNYYVGEGIIPGAADMIDLRQFMLDYNKSMFRNMGELGGLVVWKDNPTKEILDRRKAEWDTNIIGMDKVGKWVQMPGGEHGANIHPFGQSLKDMGFQEGFFLTEQDICNGYGIPIGFFDGKTGSASLASAKEHERHIEKHSILPRVTLMDAVLNEQLLPLYEKSKERLFFLSDNPIKEDREIAMKERQVNIDTGVHVINEERAADNLEPLPGFDVPWLPMNYMPAGEREQMESQIEDMIVSATEKARKRIRANV